MIMNLKIVQKPVSCEYSLENGVNQSVILTVSLFFY